MREATSDLISFCNNDPTQCGTFHPYDVRPQAAAIEVIRNHLFEDDMLHHTLDLIDSKMLFQIQSSVTMLGRYSFIFFGVVLVLLIVLRLFTNSLFQKLIQESRSKLYFCALM